MYKSISLTLALLCILALGCQQQQQTATTDAAESAAKKVLNRYLEIFNTGNMNLVNTTIDSAHFLIEPAMPDKIAGRDGFSQWVLGYRTAYSDFNLNFDEVIVKDNNCVVRWTVNGTHDGPLGELEPTGNKFKISGLTLMRMANGLITEEWIYYDNLAASMQLGLTLVPAEG